MRPIPTVLRWLMALLLTGTPASAGGGGPTTRAQGAAAPVFRNPVIATDFPDPSLLRVGHTYFAYSTNVSGVNVPVSSSSTLVKWQARGDAFPVLPEWASSGNTWAPSVLAVQGGYRLYFTARDTASGRQCIGVAASTRPEGPFTSRSPRPLVCQLTLGGSIDPQGFTDRNGAQYLYWKSDGNCCQLLTHLWGQALTADGLALKGAPHDLLHTDQPWEGNLIEAPTVVTHAGQYVLFYSAAAWDQDSYAVGYAVGPSALGPFKKVASAPVLVSRGQVAGPGGQGVLTDARGHTWMYYHAWTAGRTGYDFGGARSLRLDPLSWKDGRPSVQATTGTQPAPAWP